MEVVAISSIHVPGIDQFANGRPHENTFAVVSKHEKLPDPSGVKFNVEAVPPALDEDLIKPHLGSKQMADKMKENSATFYSGIPGYSPEDVRLEATADAPDNLWCLLAESWIFRSVPDCVCAAPASGPCARPHVVCHIVCICEVRGRTRGKAPK
jgi:hypothetical protein